MGIARSTFYDAPPVKVGDAECMARIRAICDEFEAYGYRRVTAALRHQGLIVNGKKVRWLMREHELQPRRRRRYVATTDSDYDYPIFPNLAAGIAVDGPNQLWVAAITYVTIAAGLVYLAAILWNGIREQKRETLSAPWVCTRYLEARANVGHLMQGRRSGFSSALAPSGHSLSDSGYPKWGMNQS